MDIEITGGRIFYTFPFDIPILGKFQITETLVGKLGGHASDHRTVHLADP